MGATPVFPGVPAITAPLVITQTSATDFVSFETPDGQSVLCGQVRATSTAGVDVVLQFASLIDGTDHILGEITVSAGAGTNGVTEWVDVLEGLNGAEDLALAPGEKLRVRAKVAAPSGAKITVILKGAPL